MSLNDLYELTNGVGQQHFLFGDFKPFDGFDLESLENRLLVSAVIDMDSSRWLVDFKKHMQVFVPTLGLQMWDDVDSHLPYVTIGCAEGGLEAAEMLGKEFAKNFLRLTTLCFDRLHLNSVGNEVVLKSTMVNTDLADMRKIFEKVVPGHQGMVCQMMTQELTLLRITKRGSPDVRRKFLDVVKAHNATISQQPRPLLLVKKVVIGSVSQLLKA